MSCSTLEKALETWYGCCLGCTVLHPMASSLLTLLSGFAKDTESAMVQLARECAESASDDLKNGMASNPVLSSGDVINKVSFSLACTCNSCLTSRDFFVWAMRTAPSP